MKLRSLAVNQFKRFDAPHRLDAIEDGLNLVIGPNELGKSTLLDALRAVLFDKHSSKAQAIQRLQNDRSQAAPVVDLEFEINGGAYTLTKRFMKREKAHLQCPDGTMLESDAAEAELRRLLGFQEAGRGGANPESLGMWGVLWVQQGKSFDAPTLGKSARRSFTEVVQAELGDLLGGQRGQELPAVFKDQRKELVTEVRSQPTGRYRDAIAKAEELQSELGDLRPRQTAIAATFEQLRAAQDALAQLDADDQGEQSQAGLDKARAQLSQAELYESNLRAAESKVETDRALLRQAKDAKEQRQERRNSLVAERDELSRREDELADKRKQQAAAQEPIEGLRQALQAAEAAARAAGQHERDCRLIEQAVMQGNELSSLQQRRDAIRKAQMELEAARSAAAQVTMDDETFRRVRDASSNLQTANAALSAAATRISFVFAADRLDGVVVDGEPLADPHAEIEATERATISIADRGQIHIDPSTADGVDLRSAQQDARNKFEAALAEAGVSSVSDAEQLRDQRLAREHDVTAAEREAGRLGVWGDDEAERLGELEAWQQSLTPEIGAAAAAQDRAGAASLVRAAASAHQDSRDEERTAREALEEGTQGAQSLENQVNVLQGAVQDGTDRLANSQVKFDGEVSKQSDESLEQAVHAAALELQEKQRELTTIKADQPSSTVDQLNQRVDQLSSQIEQRRDERRSLENEISRCIGSIETEGAAGIDGSIAEVERKLELARGEVEAMQRDVDVLDLLLRTLAEAERETKERYLEPIVNRIQPYLQSLFGGAQITLDDEFNLTGIVRQDGYTEPFELLSMGTQEQIAVVVRLAFAEMLADQGAPAAVILDDALVFSDDERIQLMFGILSEAARHVQIIVFTCRRQLFTGLAANQLELTEIADRDSLPSA